MNKAINSMLMEVFSFPLLFPLSSLISGYYRECHG